MTVKRPQISAVRQSNGIEFLITMLNFEEGDTWNIYRANDKFGELIEEVREHDQAAYTITGLDPDQNIMIRVSLNNAPADMSINIIEESPNAEPPTVEFEMIPPATAEMSTITIHPSWENEPLVLDAVELDGLISEWIPSQPVISIGKNQTL